MTDRPARRALPMLAVFALLALLASGCASGGNTLAQDLAWERWNKCNDGSMRLLRIESDGNVWAQATTDGGGPLPRWQACMREAAALQGKQTVSRPPEPVVTASPLATRATGTTIPQWKPGDEWAYRWESPQGSGTFVWSMDREETVDGVAYYVVKSGNTRELYYRKNDFAFYMDKVNGQVETRHSPPTAFFAWPLVPGAKMEVRYTRERPLERQTEAMVLTCETGPVEAVTVQAGTFDVVKVACRNSRTSTPNFEWWLSPAIKHHVRERTHFSYGVRERELIAVKLR